MFIAASGLALLLGLVVYLVLRRPPTPPPPRVPVADSAAQRWANQAAQRRGRAGDGPDRNAAASTPERAAVRAQPMTLPAAALAKPDDIKRMISRAIHAAMDAVRGELRARLLSDLDQHLSRVRTAAAAVPWSRAAAGVLALDKSISGTAVAIAGAEGSGKSTLINALLGDAVLPTDPNQPGTAVPIVLAAGDGGGASHRLFEAKWFAVDEALFREAVLQRSGLSGPCVASIDVATNRLGPGIGFVDLPGDEGLSAAVNALGLEALWTIDEAIIVMLNRNFGSGIRVWHKLAERDRPVVAAVVNLTVSHLVDDATAEPVAESEVEASINEARAGALRAFADAGRELSTDRVFAIHAPSIGSGSSLDRASTSAVHAREVVRFREWFEARYGLEAGRSSARRTHAAIGRALADAREEAAAEARFVHLLWRGDADAGSELRRLAEERRIAWREAASAAPVRVAVGNAEAAARVRILGALARLTEALEQLDMDARASVPSDWASQDYAFANKLAKRLTEVSASAAAEARREIKAAIQDCVARCHSLANEIVGRDPFVGPSRYTPTPVTAPQIGAILSRPSSTSSRKP